MRRTTSAAAALALGECAHLRARAEDLRAHSRNLRARSHDARERLNHAMSSLEAARSHMAVRPMAYPPRLKRLLCAEADLESAIAECRVALAEVRRELGWRDDGPAPLVH